ncbi:MAG: hypothetical protein H0X62_06100 [Bacteroidetes bacterium]|nr:hypothetical protein [Bacteroidota bacterium]
MKIVSYFFILSTLFYFTSCSEAESDNSSDASENENIIPLQAPATDAEFTPSGAAGLNPPHGEPGHRCEIEVGAPLNSEPTQPKMDITAQPEASNNRPGPTVQPEISTAPINMPTAPKAQAGAKLNPAHGEPGHDCAVAVGAPLS